MSKKKRRQSQRQRTKRQQKRAARLSKMRLRLPRPPAPPEPPDEAGLQRWSRLLNQADKDPSMVLRDPRCLKPHFVARFFDLCDGKALEAPWVAPDFAAAALALAEKTGDRHKMNLARGIAVHAAIGGSRWDEAAERLGEYRQEAFDCCTLCASDWLRRQGDLLVETRDAVRSRAYLEMAAGVLGDDLDDDQRGRILFVRGIAHFFLGDRDQALADVGEALRLLSLETARGYFMDAIAMVGCFLERSKERQHYETALAHLVAFRDRLRGQKGWQEVLDRLRWVSAQIDAWLGRPRRARARLERVRAKHVKHSPHRYALAIAVDEALIYCLHLPRVHIRSIRGILTACKQQLKLEPELRKILSAAATELGKTDWRAREILVALRRSFVVPVPGLLTDRVIASASAE